MTQKKSSSIVQVGIGCTIILLVGLLTMEAHGFRAVDHATLTRVVVGSCDADDSGKCCQHGDWIVCESTYHTPLQCVTPPVYCQPGEWWPDACLNQGASCLTHESQKAKCIKGERQKAANKCTLTGGTTTQNCAEETARCAFTIQGGGFTVFCSCLSGSTLCSPPPQNPCLP